MKRRAPTAQIALACAAKFEKWLIDRGAQIIKTTNEWEIIRFKTGKGVSVMYRKKEPNSLCTFIGCAEQAWHEFLNPGSRWRAIPATVRKQRPDKTLYDTIRSRDGCDCFYCAELLPPNEGTIEHLISITHGGPDHISNKFLAHAICNQRAGNLSAVEKIAIYHKARINKLRTTSGR